MDFRLKETLNPGAVAGIFFLILVFNSKNMRAGLPHLLLLIIFLFPAAVSAQDDELGKALTKSLGNLGAKKKAKLDSVDFQFAISVNENAGLIDVKQKGEQLTRGLYSMKEQQEKTPEEIGRDTVDFATNLYQLKLYKLAESSFIDAKNYLEQQQLTGDISYVRCMSNLALVYMAQGKTNESEEYVNIALQASNTLGQNSAA